MSQLGEFLILWREKKIWPVNIVWKKSLLVVNHSCTTMNLREKRSTERGCQKEETGLKPDRKGDLRRGYCTRYSSAQAELRYRNHAKRRKAYYRESVLAEITVFTTEFGRTLAFAVTNVYMIKYLLTSACSCRSVSKTRTSKFASAWPCALWLLLGPTPKKKIKKNLTGQKFCSTWSVRSATF